VRLATLVYADPNSGVTLKMTYVDVAPVIFEILRDQAPMTMMGLIFTAKETPLADELFGDCSLNLTRPH
jgi:hypothetical protein